jgi:SAM-dependent methyltransferase
VDNLKQEVLEFWNEESCGERLLLDATDKPGYLTQMEKRYSLEPFIEGFARFDDSRDLDVLEIGIGLGADHQRFAQSGARLAGIDLTERAVEHTRRRFDLFGLTSILGVGDAESLQYPDAAFDVVYSWGVLHHSPDTGRAIDEVWRVLRHGGVARIMIYHKHSLVGYMLWVRYAMLAGKPWRSLSDIYAHHLESPGTKAYSMDEARTLFRNFSDVRISTVLTHGDLLESAAGQRHRSLLLSMAKLIWPRPLFRLLMPKCGLFMLIEARK